MALETAGPRWCWVGRREGRFRQGSVLVKDGGVVTVFHVKHFGSLGLVQILMFHVKHSRSFCVLVIPTGLFSKDCAAVRPEAHSGRNFQKLLVLLQ